MTQRDNFLRKENPQITTQHRKRYSTSRSSYTKLPFPTNRLLVGRHNSTTPRRGISTSTKFTNAFAIPLLHIYPKVHLHTYAMMLVKSYSFTSCFQSFSIRKRTSISRGLTEFWYIRKME